LAVGLVALPALTAGVVSLLAPAAMAQPAAKSQTHTIVSYAVTKSAYDQIFKLFAADWQKIPVSLSLLRAAMVAPAPKSGP
jgi:ABC-type sulfate transport system substrate-binding protein